MSLSVMFAFRPLQKVRIKEIEALGFVLSRMNNAESQNEYKVSYWMDGKKSDGWFYEFELEAA